MEGRRSRATFSPPSARRKEVSRRDNPAEKFGEDPVTTEIKGKKWELFENREMRLRNQRHLEMACEWLRGRGKFVPVKDGPRTFN